MILPPARPKTLAKSRALKILVVDDELPIREVLSAFLREAGHQVETAADGRIALGKYMDGPCDVVMMDRVMPEMSGDALAAAIRQLNPEQPIIMVTGSADVVPRPTESRSIDLVIRKPFTRETIRAGLACVLGDGLTSIGSDLPS